MKWRNSKERELLASGGSREQTLPNKNNPNPDLSDADSDKPKIDLSDLSPLHSPNTTGGTGPVLLSSYRNGDGAKCTDSPPGSPLDIKGNPGGHSDLSCTSMEYEDEEIHVT